MADETTAFDTFKAAKDAAEAAKGALVDRLAAIAVEKKETNARLKAEAKEIRALIGRPRKAGTPKAKKEKAPRPVAAAKAG
jgi:hypothetical protein